MDIFIFPSHAEAFGIALVEAMSMGKPTICSNSDGVLDIAVDDITSYLFEKQNKESLSQNLIC
jgi:glycosyltransferase involved in cell wall biosynthesis